MIGRSAVGTNTPPTIATPVPALPPIVNSYPQVSAPPNSQSATEALYTNGVHPYQGKDLPPVFINYNAILYYCLIIILSIL